MTDLEQAMRTLAQQVKLDTIEACAKLIEPKTPRPCDCEPLHCYCRNQGDADAVASWDTDAQNAKTLREFAEWQRRTPQVPEAAK
jgi:hypothetical protein